MYHLVTARPPKTKATSGLALFFLLFCNIALSCSVHASMEGSSSSSLNTPPIRSVVVVGGTHGNEYTGVWMSKALQRRLDRGDYESHSFQLSTILGNPLALEHNRRFIDEDLNRQFSYEALQKEPKETNEAKRAAELNELLGPKNFEGDDQKQESCSSPPKTDLIIDLHTTTTNMGTTLIIAQGDPLTAQMAAYVRQNCPPETRVSILMHTHKNQKERPHLSSIAPHCFSIETGPVAQGVIRQDIVDHTQQALDKALEFLDRWNREPEKLKEELLESCGDEARRFPCWVSAASQRPGEISSKIAWPSDPEHVNFPQWMVHSSVQDKDFELIHEGDALFVDLDNNVIPYNGSHGSPIRLMFINEGGYYYASSGTGISVANLRHFDVATGRLLPEETK